MLWFSGMLWVDEILCETAKAIMKTQNELNVTEMRVCVEAYSMVLSVLFALLALVQHHSSKVFQGMKVLLYSIS